MGVPARIIGREKLQPMAAFDDVAPGMDFDEEIILGAHASHWSGDHIPDGSAIYNMEPLYEGCRSLSVGYMDILKRCRVIDYSRRNVEFLAVHGVDAFHLPYGWHAGLVDEPSSPAKDIEVLLIGSENPRRSAIVDRLRMQFDVAWCSGLYGQKRAEMAARAIVHLNIHFHENHPLEVARLNWLLANGHNTVSEPGNDEQQNSAYEHGCRISFDLEEAIGQAMQDPIDGSECIKRMDCREANEWLKSRKELICHG